MSEGRVPSAGARFLLGLACAAAGTFPILSAFDVGPFHPDSINGPPWLGVVAGGIFVVGALFLWTGDATIRRPWLGGLFAIAMLLAFAAIGNWIAFGAGTRECGSEMSVGGFADARTAGDLECRVAFGIGALMIDGILVWMLGTGLRAMGMPGRLPGWIEKLGQGLLAVALAPIVLLLAVAITGKRVVDACITFVRTGAWPRRARPANGTAEQPGTPGETDEGSAEDRRWEVTNPVASRQRRDQ